MERTVGASDWAMTKNSLPDLMEVMRTSISPETATSVGCVVSVCYLVVRITHPFVRIPSLQLSLFSHCLSLFSPHSYHITHHSSHHSSHHIKQST